MNDKPIFGLKIDRNFRQKLLKCLTILAYKLIREQHEAFPKSKLESEAF